MSKYIRVTHTYLVPMPDDLPDNDPAMETTINRGVSMMEQHMLKLYEDPRRCMSLATTWELISEEARKQIDTAMGMGIEKDITYTQGKVPKRVVRGGRVGRIRRNPDEQDRIDSLRQIEGDFDGGVSFAQDVMGQREARVPHPWDQGLWIFPEGHPLREVEEKMKKNYDSLPGDPEMQGLIMQELKELEAGDGES